MSPRILAGFVLSMLFSVQIYAAKTTLKGYVPGAENLSIRLYTYDDYFSNREVLIATAPVDSTGHFQIVVNVFEKQVITAFFRVMDFTSQEMYIPAGKIYELEFAPFDYKDPNRIHIQLLSTVILRYTIKNADPHDVNSLIGSYNYDQSSFVINLMGIDGSSVNTSVKRPQKSKVDSFVRVTTEKYKNESNEFFKNYYQYSLANLQMNLQSVSKKKLFDEFVYKKPILYDNVAYMEFFSNYFSDFIFGVSHKIQPYDIIENVNYRVNLSGLVDSLGKDTLLRNEQIREAVLLLNIRDWYTSITFSQDSLVKLLDVYAAKTKFDIQARIARNIKFMLTRFNTGSPVPEFSFQSLDDSRFTNDSLQGRYTFIIFFTTWSHPCLSELLVADQLYPEWKDSIRFVGVSMDREPLKLFYFLEDNSFSFPVYHFGGDWGMAEKLCLQTYPHCMLLDKKGKFIQFSTPTPSRGVVELFTRVAGVKVATNDFEVGQ